MTETMISGMVKAITGSYKIKYTNPDKVLIPSSRTCMRSCFPRTRTISSPFLLLLLPPSPLLSLLTLFLSFFNLIQ